MKTEEGNLNVEEIRAKMDDSEKNSPKTDGNVTELKAALRAYIAKSEYQRFFYSYLL